jgi:hypothetical protein
MAAFRIGLALHAVASFAYWIAQPRGFEVASRSFLEHQVVAPVLFAISVGGLLNRRASWISVGVVGGFWIVSSAIIAVLGSTVPSRLFWPGLAGSIGLVVVGYRRLRPDPSGLLTGGTVVGMALAGLFWFATWAPPATTRPLGAEIPSDTKYPPASSFETSGIRVTVEGESVIVESGGRRAVLRPGFDYSSVSDRGLWTIFQFRSSFPPGWTSRSAWKGGLTFWGDNEDLAASGHVWIQDRTVHVRCVTQVYQEIASHLSSVMQLDCAGEAAVEGIPWRLDHLHERSEFVAFRNGRMEFLRASSREKGPFETLGSWEIRDPQLTIDGWKIRVLGWAQQGSHEASPTAGWGVSQAALERVGSTYFWSLASTSIGRGWHTVRTAPGVYVLEAVLTPP